MELNLVGVTDAGSGESRRNENVQFNPGDNNALKDLNVRLGATATVIDVFRPERGYFGSEFDNPPSQPINVDPFTLWMTRYVFPRSVLLSASREEPLAGLAQKQRVFWKNHEET